jgi:hypothetical protein
MTAREFGNVAVHGLASFPCSRNSLAHFDDLTELGFWGIDQSVCLDSDYLEAGRSLVLVPHSIFLAPCPCVQSCTASGLNLAGLSPTWHPAGSNSKRLIRLRLENVTHP